MHRLAALLILAGCASSGPIHTERFDAAVRGSLEDGETVIAYERAAWLPNTLGYNGIVFDPSQVTTIPGVVLCTNRRLVFVTWDTTGRSYAPAFSVSRSDILAHDVRSYMASCRVAIRTRTVGVHSFEVATAGGFASREGNHRIDDCLSSH
jgi:hypothetical protein